MANNNINANNTMNLSLRSILEKDKLTGPNFRNWKRNLQIVLHHERKWYVLETPLYPAPSNDVVEDFRNAYTKLENDLLDVQCLMLATMSPELQVNYMETSAYDLICRLRETFQSTARTKRFDATKDLNSCKMAEGSVVSTYVVKTIGYLNRLERLGHAFPQELAIDIILAAMSKEYNQFVLNYNMNNTERSIHELHQMLKIAQRDMEPIKSKDVLMFRDGGI